MAEIRGFKGLRYTEKAGDLNTLVCPPYDIISDKQREEYIAKNPYNVIRLELPKGGDDRYAIAGATLKEWVDNDILAQDGEESIYIYGMEFSSGGRKHSLKGFVSLVKVEEFSAGVVLPHEETLSKDKADRFNLMCETHCNFSQVYSLYTDEDKSVSVLIENCSKAKADMCVTDGDDTVHRMWRVTDKNVIAGIKAAFMPKKLYIADGHHRYETALKFKQEHGEEYLMMMLVNMENEGLIVYPTHRIVRNLDSFKLDKVLEGCKPYFDIKESSDEENMKSELDRLYKDGKKAFALYAGGGKCFIMTLTDEKAVKNLLPEKSDAYCGLDVSVLHNLVLERIFGIDKENMANQKNLIYTRVLQEALTAVDIDGADCSFILNTTKVSEIKDVVSSNERMPQKSTYFYPKLITGLVINRFGRQII